MTDDRAVAFAVAAHPDDIEFMMAGTLLLLKDAGYEIHYMTVGNGSCGTLTESAKDIVRIRTAEARRAAELIGAVYHPSYLPDLEIFFNKEALCKLASVMRQVNPSVLLVPSPDDYMEDHVNTSRLAVTAAFTMGLRNFPTSPRRKHVLGDTTIYHALPHGLRNSLRRRIWPDQYVDIHSVMDRKRQMLAQHKSQKEWLDKTQGMDSYLDTMVEMCGEVGKMSGRFTFSEAWQRHNHLGFSAEEIDPLTEALGEKAMLRDVSSAGNSGEIKH